MQFSSPGRKKDRKLHLKGKRHEFVSSLLKKVSKKTMFLEKD